MRCQRRVVLWAMSPQRCEKQLPNPGEKVDSAVELDQSENWLKEHITRAVDEGRQSKESAEYFESIINSQSEFRQCVQEAHRLIGDQNPHTLTRYQQGRYADHLSRYMSGIASERLMRAKTEETNAQRHARDGTPTGENYWFEAGNTLASPSVPGFVKDEVLREMRKERSPTSPAFEEPAEVGAMVEKEKSFAEHMRRQRRRLLRSEDFLD